MRFSSFSKDLKLIFFYQAILSFVNGMLGLFLPIFFFKNFHNSLFLVIAFYGISYLLYALLVPLGAMVVTRIGLKKSIIIGRSLSILFYIVLLFFRQNILLAVIFLEIILLLFRLFYWVPYHVDFAEFTDKKLRGREISLLRIVNYIISVFAPLSAGLVLAKYNFNFLFVVALLLFAASILPLSMLRDVREKFSFGYLQTFRVLFQPQNRKLRIAYGADGAQNFVGVIVWPIFVFQLLHQNYVAVGSISALIIGVTILFQYLTGRYVDTIGSKKVLRLGSGLYSLAWFLKAFVVTAYHIFLVGAFQSLAALVLRTPFDSLFYEKAADEGSYVDEYTVLREISINTGRVLCALLVVLLVLFLGIRASFIVAALFSLLLNFL